MPRGEFKHRYWFFADTPNVAWFVSVIWKDLLWRPDFYRHLKLREGWTIPMFQLSVWCEKWVGARHYSVIGNQLLFVYLRATCLPLNVVENQTTVGRLCRLGSSECYGAFTSHWCQHCYKAIPPFSHSSGSSTQQFRFPTHPPRGGVRAAQAGRPATGPQSSFLPFPVTLL